MSPLPRSEAERISRLSEEDHAAWWKKTHLPSLAHVWDFWRRTDQAEPQGAWTQWLVLAGRGYGKTRMGAEWVRAAAEADGRLHIALVASTAAEGRNVMIEGTSGLLAIAPDATRPEWEPSLRRLRWPGGATATLYSAAEPDSLRGPEHHLAWCDEIAKWDRGEDVWANLAMTMRLGTHPRIVATTTPRPVPLVRRLIADADTVCTRGRMEDNHDNLPARFIDVMGRTYGGTRLGRQELDGELIEDMAGALWSRAALDACRVAHVPPLRRVVVGVDPPAGSDGDACGIVAVGKGEDGHAYVLGRWRADGLCARQTLRRA